jgi:hypothetical protein
MKEKTLFIICLGTTHTVEQCYSLIRCQNCYEKHNTIMHQGEKTKRLVAVEDGNNSPESEENYTMLTTNDDSNSCTLPVIELKLALNNVEQSIPNFLPDLGSQQNIISKKCLVRYNLTDKTKITKPTKIEGISVKSLITGSEIIELNIIASKKQA